MAIATTAAPHPFDMLAQKPRVRGDCAGNIRPCAWVSCRHHLLLDVLEDGSIVLNAKYKRPTGSSRVISSKRENDARFLDEADDAIEAVFDEPDPSVPSCSLDVAEANGVNIDHSVEVDREGMQLEEISLLMFVSRERVRQIESSGIAKMVDPILALIEDLGVIASEEVIRRVKSGAFMGIWRW